MVTPPDRGRTPGWTPGWTPFLDPFWVQNRTPYLIKLGLKSTGLCNKKGSGYGPKMGLKRGKIPLKWTHFGPILDPFLGSFWGPVLSPFSLLLGAKGGHEMDPFWVQKGWPQGGPNPGGCKKWLKKVHFFEKRVFWFFLIFLEKPVFFFFFMPFTTICFFRFFRGTTRFFQKCQKVLKMTKPCIGVHG